MLPPPDNSTCYARSQLKGKELQLYDSIVSTLQMGQNALSTGHFDANRALEITMLVLRDHPEFYWVAGAASFGGFGSKLKLTKCISPDRTLEAHVMDVLDDFASSLPPSCSDYTKAKKAYELIATCATYDNDTSQSTRHLVVSHSLWGVFGERRAVCDGFSSALQFLLQHVGICAYRLTGTATSQFESGLHSWVLARIDGNYYHIDPTWSVMSLEGMAQNEDVVAVNYDYLCLRDSDVVATHHPEEAICVEPCKSKNANYYVQEGLVVQLWDERFLADCFARQLTQGLEWISVRAATHSLFERLQHSCEAGDSLYTLVIKALKDRGEKDSDPGRLAYTTNADLRTIHLLFIGANELSNRNAGNDQ